jgi:hypothetical protein
LTLVTRHPLAPLLHRSFTGSLVTKRSAQLLSHFLKLLTDYRAVEAIDGNVKPITFFAFYHELIAETVMDAAVCAGSALGL